MSVATAPPVGQETPPPATQRRFDPLTWLTALVALAVYLPHGFDGWLTRDLGVYSYGGQQVAEGVPPYVAILNRAGPLGHLVPGAAAFVARQVGMDDLLAMRILFLLISCACIGATYALARDVLGSRLAGLAAAATMLCFEGFATYATYGPREKTLLVLFVLLMFHAMLRRRWFLTGFFIALATLTWQPVFLAGIVAAGVAVLLDREGSKVRGLVRLAVGGLLPLAVTVGCYAAIGQLQVFLDDFVLINARYTEQISYLGDPGLLYEVMTAGYGWSLWLFVAGCVALLAQAGAAIASARRRELPQVTLVAAGILFVVGFAWSVKALNGWPDNFFMLPGAALGIGGVVAWLARRFGGRVAAAATGAWLVAAVALALTFSITARDDGLDRQRRDTAAVVALLPDGARIASVGAPQPLVLSHERNISRLQLFGNGLLGYVDDTWRGGVPGYAAWIAKRDPAIIALGDEEGSAWIAPTLASHYTCLGRSRGWSWFGSRSLDHQTLHDLRATLTGGCPSMTGTSP